MTPSPAPDRAALALAIRIQVYLVGAVLVANVPARWSIATHQAQFGTSRPAFVLTALAVDVRDWLGVFAVLGLGLVALGWLIRRKTARAAGRGFEDAIVRWLPWPTAVLFVLVLLGHNAATEFKIERGLYPTVADLEMALSDAGFVRTSWHVFVLDRYLAPSIVALFAFAALTERFVGARRVRASRRPWHLPALLAAGSAAFIASGFGMHRASPLLFRSLPNWRVVESPFMVFVGSGSDYENIRMGAMALFEQLEIPAELRGRGARALGFAGEAGAKLDPGGPVATCTPHPFAEPLDGGLAPSSGRDAELRGALVELSAALFADRSGRLTVWHVVLESMRAADIHALNPAAPRAIAPRLTALYEQAREPSPRVLAAEHMLEGANRTSQALAAVSCGLGTIPFGLSAARDLGLLPLRCLPDVLEDAGFSAAFYYGSNPGFDNMLAFLNYHGFDHAMTERAFREQVPRRGWAVPDALVFAQALDDAASRGPRSQYNLVLSLTNHFPFLLPEDFPDELGRVVDRAMAESTAQAAPDDVSRLKTLAYSDWALGALLDRIESSPQAAESIVVINADHVDNAFFVFKPQGGVEGQGRDVGDPTGMRRALTALPFLVVVPEPLLRSARDPALVSSALRRVNDALERKALSQNDTPRLLLALLSSWHEVARIPSEWRWHTLGGQALSPSFGIDGSEAAIVGIDGNGKLFSATERGEFLETDEVVPLLHDPDEAASASSLLRPSAATLAAFLRGYARACRGAEHIRRRP